MFRIFKTAIALSGLLALAACNSVMAPQADVEDEKQSAARDSKRNTHEFIALRGERAPLPEDGGGTGSRNDDVEPQQRQSAERRRDRTRHEVAPMEGEGTGGSGVVLRACQCDPSPSRVRRSQHEVAPTP